MVIAVAVIAWLASLVRLLEPGIRSAIAIALGIALGLALVHATRSWPKHPKGERNLAYILEQWEPPRGSTETPPSVVLPANR